MNDPCQLLMRVLRATTLCYLFLTITAVQAVEVDRILEQATIPIGVACVPECGDGALALELARRGWLVLALDQDETQVIAATKAAVTAGLYGRTLHIEQGQLSSLPWADNYVDLLVLPALAEKKLTEAQRAEIMRVLTPVLGRAVFTDSVIAKPQLPGSDWWPHKRHGPDNNSVSRDTVFQLPPITQNRAMPMLNSGYGATVTLDGINIEIMDWELTASELSRLCGRMFARNIYNGRILWQDEAPLGLTTSMPILAAADGLVYYPCTDRAAIIRRDMRTGKMQKTIELGGNDRRVKWLAVVDGQLYTLLGGEHSNDRPFTWVIPSPKDNITELKLFGNELVPGISLKTRRAGGTRKQSRSTIATSPSLTDASTSRARTTCWPACHSVTGRRSGVTTRVLRRGMATANTTS